MFGWFKRSKSKPDDEIDSKKLLDGCFEAVSKLGDTMQAHPIAILDTKMLPLPKEQMKFALKVTYKSIEDQHLRNSVELAYSHLSHFQDGVGDVPVDPTISAGISPKDAAAKLEPWLARSKQVETETKSLLAEFQEFKNSLTDK